MSAYTVFSVTTNRGNLLHQERLSELTDNKYLSHMTRQNVSNIILPKTNNKTKHIVEMYTEGISGHPSYSEVLLIKYFILPASPGLSWWVSDMWWWVCEMAQVRCLLLHRLVVCENEPLLWTSQKEPAESRQIRVKQEQTAVYSLKKKLVTKNSLPPVMVVHVQLWWLPSPSPRHTSISF